MCKNNWQGSFRIFRHQNKLFKASFFFLNLCFHVVPKSLFMIYQRSSTWRHSHSFPNLFISWTRRENKQKKCFHHAAWQASKQKKPNMKIENLSLFLVFRLLAKIRKCKFINYVVCGFNRHSSMYWIVLVCCFHY